MIIATRFKDIYCTVYSIIPRVNIPVIASIKVEENICRLMFIRSNMRQTDALRKPIVTIPTEKIRILVLVDFIP